MFLHQIADMIERSGALLLRSTHRSGAAASAISRSVVHGVSELRGHLSTILLPACAILHSVVEFGELLEKWTKY